MDVGQAYNDAIWEATWSLLCYQLPIALALIPVIYILIKGFKKIDKILG